MDDYLDKFKSLLLGASWKHRPDAPVDYREIFEYRLLSGKLHYLSQCFLPYAWFFASKMQQRLGRLTVRHLIEAHDMLSDL